MKQKLKKIEKSIDKLPGVWYNIITKEQTKERYKTMINIRTLRKLKENDGLTLKAGKPIVYRSGYQVATEGIETTDIKVAMAYVRKWRTCGIWFSNGIYYIDMSKRIATKREALEIGRNCQQISILKWQNMELIYC